MSNTNKQRVTLFLNPGLLTHTRAQAVVEGRTLTALVERALNSYLPRETIVKKVEIR
jgi:hypothetical protein